MNIRLEKEEDFFEVEKLTREAFWNVYCPGCREHFVLHNFRKSPNFIKELDFVLEETKDGKTEIVAHVMFSRAMLIRADGKLINACTFGPISVKPELQKKGYGKHLLNYALDKARALNLGVCCMTGNIAFYKNCGFSVAKKLGINYAEAPDSDAPYFLAQELNNGYLLSELEGQTCTFKEPTEYFVKDEDVERFDAQFPPKQKLRLPGQLF